MATLLCPTHPETALRKSLLSILPNVLVPNPVAVSIDDFQNARVSRVGTFCTLEIVNEHCNWLLGDICGGGHTLGIILLIIIDYLGSRVLAGA